MSIDRRIVSILYYNDIFDIEDVEKFVGEKDNYYEIIIDGELKKLKIPGFVYPNDERIMELKEKMKKTVELAKDLREPENEEEQKELDDIYNDIQDLGNFLDEIKNSNTVKDFFEDEMKKNDEENAAFLEKMKEDEVKEIFKQPELEKVVEEIKENKKLVVTKTEVKVTKPKVTKNVKTKKPDIDIDDFMNTI